MSGTVGHRPEGSGDWLVGSKCHTVPGDQGI